MKTFPCIKGQIGDWTFYSTTIRLNELVNYVKFADQVYSRADLDQIVQRELTKRSDDISKYLLSNQQRFMGSLIVAAVGGEPKFVPIGFGDDSSFNFADGKIGFLRFDGSENYYALDGQHRLAAIHEVLEKEPDRFAKDEVSLIIIWHSNDQAGRIRARRLFTTLNRYARKTTRAEDILFDEDNPVDIYTRRLVREHDFFKQRTKVTNLAKQGEFRLTKSESLRVDNEYDANFLFALLTLRRCNDILLNRCFIQPKVTAQVLPDFETLEDGYELLCSRWETLLSHVIIWRSLRADPNATLQIYRHKKGGNPLVRPIAIIAFIEACATLLDNNGDPEIITKVSGKLDDLSRSPFLGLLWKNSGGMYDGQRRRKAVSILYSHYINGQPSHEVCEEEWQKATASELLGAIPSRVSVLE